MNNSAKSATSWLATIVFAAVIWFVIKDYFPSQNRQAPKETQSQPRLRLVESKEMWDQGHYIGGRIKNEGGAASSASVFFSLYNEHGESIGSAVDSITHLDAGGIWRFKARVGLDDPVKFKFKEIYVSK